MFSEKEAELDLYLPKTYCEVTCWQQRLECEWNAKLKICEADAQEYEPWLLTMFLHSLT